MINTTVFVEAYGVTTVTVTTLFATIAMKDEYLGVGMAEGILLGMDQLEVVAKGLASWLGPRRTLTRRTLTRRTLHLDNCVRAVDHQHGAIDVTRAIAGQKHCTSGHFIRGARPPGGAGSACAHFTRG